MKKIKTRYLHILLVTGFLLFAKVSPIYARDYNCPLSGEQSISIAPDYFNIFINAYEIPKERPARLAYFRKLKDAGFHTVRFQLNWMIIQPSSKSWNWGFYDPIFKDLQTIGLKALPTINRIPKWARGTNKDLELLEPKYYPAYQKFIETLVKRYSQNVGWQAKTVAVWEMWNEPDNFYGGSPENLVEMSNLAYDAIKATDPKAKVMSPSTSTRGLNALTNQPVASTAEFYKQIIKNGKFDIMNVHIYKNLRNSIELVGLIKQNLLQDGNQLTKKAKLAVTESNEQLWPCSVINDKTELQREIDIVNRYVCLNQFGVDYLYYFKTFDEAHSTCNDYPENKIAIGIFDKSFDTAYTPRSTYFAIQEMIASLTSGTPTATPSPTTSPTGSPAPNPSVTPQTLRGDLNGDNKVDLADYNLFISKFGNPYNIYHYNNLVANFKK